MSKKVNRLIPELRFPEFVNEGEWVKVALDELSEIIKGEQLNRIELTEVGKYPCQNGGISPSGYTDKFNTEENTITISEGGNSCGYVNFMTSNFWLGGHCYKLVLRKNINKLFLYQLLKFNENNIMKLRVGSGLPNIQLKAIRKFDFVISNSQEEQQKIASCLSSLDELIIAHNQKLEALKAHKKGLMQNLFPQEGETVPKYRFPEFENDEEWVEKKLGAWVDFVMGNAFRSEDFVEDGLQLIRMGNLYQGDLQLNRTPVYLPKSFEAEYSRFLIKPKDLLMSMTGTMGKKDYGFVIEIPENTPVLLLNQRVLKIIPKKTVLQGFVLQQLKNDTFLHKLYSIPGGTKQANLSTKDLKEIEILFPLIQEQQKIASCLSSLDTLITAQTEKIEQLKLHKKGLMQGLFPRI